jgi:ribonuclease P protein component
VSADRASPAGSGETRKRFPKSRRLRARREFLAVQASGVRVHTPHFLLVVARGPSAEAPARLGVTVTRKVGDAVRRNRVKRVVREAFRLDPTLLPAGVDLLVIAKNGAPLLGLAEVTVEWSRARTQLQRRAREVLSEKPPPKTAPPAPA